MTMETFNFPYHSVSTNNPETGFRGQLGGNYMFTSEPTDPDQRTFVLNFSLMKFFTTVDPEDGTDTGTLDETIEPELNMFSLIKFYQRHKLYKSFLYAHPVHGTLEVKFNKPLNEKEPTKGGTGAVTDFTVELVEIP